MFQTAVVDEPSEFEPLKFYCIQEFKINYTFTESLQKEPFYLLLLYVYFHIYIQTEYFSNLNHTDFIGIEPMTYYQTIKCF